MTKYQRVVFLLIVVGTAAVFATLWSAPPLTWDDDSNIFNNPYFRAGWWLTFWQSAYFGLYVPVTSFVWQVIYTYSNGAFWPYRALNLYLHLANVGLVFVLLRSLSTRWKLNTLWPAILGTALFALHPLQVETVAWISGGRDALSAFFTLIAVCFYFRDERWRSFILATVFFVLALLSKPSVVVLPVLFALFDLFLRRQSIRQLYPRLAIWLLFSLAAIYQTRAAQADHIPSVEWWQRPWIMLDTFAFYVRGLLWPWPLSANYARTPEYVLSQTRTLIPALIFLAALVSFAGWAFRKDRRILPVIAAWLLLLLPVSGLVSFAFQKISTPADHYHYLAMAAVAAGVVWSADRLVRWHRPFYILGTVVLLAFLVVSFWRVQVWTSDEAFFKDMASYAPHSYSSGIGMSIVMCQDLKEYEEGVRWTEVALKARPNDILALGNQAYCYLHAGNHFKVTELDAHLDSLDLENLERTQPTAYSSFLASIGTSMIELKDYERGYQYLCEAYRVKPAEPHHARNLEIATRILKEQGLVPVCEDSGDSSPEGGIETLLAPPQEDGE
ncbi:MAG: hypothetical protein KF799_00855 [Bdellovibrionales bacterium]|nr:hypothetical protein [Bdellovibrionales bacterium]